MATVSAREARRRAQAFDSSPQGCRGRSIYFCEFQANLVYRASPRTARSTNAGIKGVTTMHGLNFF